MANVYQSVLDAGGSTPTSITPTNSSPAFMSSGGTYQPTANGYAIESYSSKTPSDSTPPSVASGDIVKANGAGYLVESNYRRGVITTGLPTGISQEISFDTGLSSIQELWVWANSAGTYQDKAQQFVRYNSNDGNYYYAVGGYTSGGSQSGQAVFASIGTAQTRTPAIMSISGGTVTLKTASGSNVYGAWSELRWMAR